MSLYNSEKDIRDRTFRFAKRIIEICEKLPNTIECNIIRKQLIKSGTSIGANVEEADGAETKADKANKIAISRKEARETRYWLRIISNKYISEEEIKSDIDECGEFIKIFSSIINKPKAR